MYAVIFRSKLDLEAEVFMVHVSSLSVPYTLTRTCASSSFVIDIHPVTCDYKSGLPLKSSFFEDNREVSCTSEHEVLTHCAYPGDLATK